MMKANVILKVITGDEFEFPPLEFVRAVRSPRRAESPAAIEANDSDTCLTFQWGQKTVEFVAELVCRLTPATFQAAIVQIRKTAQLLRRPPLLLVPYLSPERLMQLESVGVSGMDMCGNGVIVVPGRMRVFRTGNPNRYPMKRTIRHVYRGASSFVARAFLAQVQFESVQAIQESVRLLGGDISLGTVSKALKMMVEDLLVVRDKSSIRLIGGQESTLLEQMEREYRPPEVAEKRSYRANGAWQQRLQAERGATVGENLRAVLTGESSVESYAVLPRERTVRVYCDSIDAIETMLGAAVTPVDRFADLELLETEDATVFFDARAGDGVSIASPVQCWLELRQGDKRQRDASETVRERIIADIASHRDELP